MNTTLDQQIAQIQAEIEAEQQAERERVEREQKHKRAIEARQRKLHELETQRTRKTLNDLLKGNEVIVERLKVKIRTLHNAMLNYDIERSIDAFKAYQVEYRHLVDHVDKIVSANASLPVNMPDTGNDPATRILRNEALDRHFNSVLDKVNLFIEPTHAVIVGISKGKNDNEYQCLIGVAYALTGRLFSVPRDDYDAIAESRAWVSTKWVQTSMRGGGA